jgi:hypothetical protein
MDIEEREIFLFLKTYGSNYVNGREICRRAGGRRRYDEDHEWAKPILSRMVERGILETNAEGQFRLKPRKKKKEGMWVSPDIEKILKESGLEVESAGGTEAESDDFYEQL